MSEDRPFSKIFWIVAGTVIAGLVGVPLTYLTGILAPRPTLVSGIKHVSYWGGNWTMHFTLHNASTQLSVKEVLIKIDVNFWNKHGNEIDTIDQIEPDPFCHAVSFANEWDSMSAVIDCDIINPGEDRDLPIVSKYAGEFVDVYISYDGGSFKRSYSLQPSEKCPQREELSVETRKWSMSNDSCYLDDTSDLQPRNP